MGCGCEALDQFAVKAGHFDGEFDFDAETAAIFTRADADCGMHLGVFRNLHIFLAGNELERAEEAGGIADREKLFRVGAGCAVAAEFLRGRQRDVENAIVCDAVAGAAAGGMGMCGIEDCHGCCPCLRVGRYIYIAQSNCAQLFFAH